MLECALVVLLPINWP